MWVQKGLIYTVLKILLQKYHTNSVFPGQKKPNPNQNKTPFYLDI